MTFTAALCRYKNKNHFRTLVPFLLNIVSLFNTLQSTKHTVDVELVDVVQLKCCAAKLILEMVLASSDLMVCVQPAWRGREGGGLSKILPHVAQR